MRERRGRESERSIGSEGSCLHERGRRLRERERSVGGEERWRTHRLRVEFRFRK